MITRAFFLLLSMGVTVSLADTFVFTSTYPVVGPPQEFQIFQVSLTTPTSGNVYSLSIQTNYGATIPGTTAVVPDYQYSDGNFYGMSDLLINWEGSYYGIVLSAHDGYVAGDMYQASGFQTSAQVLDNRFDPVPNVPVLLDAGGTLKGTGTESGSVTGNGVTTGMYTVNVQFTAPTGFLSTGYFYITASSYICANGLITGEGGDVPEPGTWLLFTPALVALGFKSWRARRRSVS